MIQDVSGLEISYGEPGELAKQTFAWPQSADILLIGRKAILASSSISRAGPRLYRGDSIRLVPHSRSHALSVAASRWLQPGMSPSEREHHDSFVKKAAGVFSHPEIQADLDNLLLVSSNRWGRHDDRIGFFAMDLEALPSLYDVALVMMRAIGLSRIVVRAVPILGGFCNVCPAPGLESYKHPGGMAYESLHPLEPATIKSALELSVGSRKLSISPLY